MRGGKKEAAPEDLPFRRERLTIAAVLSLLAPIPLVFTGSVAPAVLLAYLAVTGGLLLSVRKGRIPCLPNWALNLAGVAYILLFWFIIRFGTRSLLKTALHMLLFTTVLKLASIRRERDLAVALILSTFLLVASMATSAHSTILLFLVAYAAAAWPLLARWALYRDLAEAAEEVRREPEARRLPPPGPTAAAIALALAAAVPFFFVLPRLKEAYTPGRAESSEVWTGFTEAVDSSLYGRLRQSNKVLLRVAVEEGTVASGEPGFLRLRLTAFGRYAGGVWTKPDPEGRLLGVREGMAVPLVPPGVRPGPSAYRLAIELTPLHSRFLPYPVTAHALTLSGDLFRRVGAAPVQRDRLANLRLPFEPDRLIRYEVAAGLAPVADLREPGEEDVTRRSPRSERIRDFAREAVPGVDPAADPFLFARRLEAHLATRFLYTLDIPRPGPNPVEEFLYSRKAGHCETFATAMALVLRANGVPARLVTGFAGGEAGPFGSYYLVRGRDAHAWLEAWCGPERGWVSFDPTPADGQPGVERVSLGRRVGQFFENLEFLYGRWILGFAASDQVTVVRLVREAAAEVGQALTRSADALKQALAAGRSAAGTAGALLLAGAAILALVAAVQLVRSWAPWRTRGLPPGAAAYRKLQRALRRRGAPLTPASAPGETLRAAEPFGPGAHAVARSVIGLYVAESFGGRALGAEDGTRLGEALAAFRRLLAVRDRAAGAPTPRSPARTRSSR